MDGNLRFGIFIVVALLVFVGILKLALRRRSEAPPRGRVFVTALVVVAGGMLFARIGQNGGLPWWIYYTVPMLVTVFGPPVVFRMNLRESIAYLAMAFLSSPLIHVLFSFFLGWKDYMPFLDVPAIWEL